jgi:hypothetical protein
VPQPEIVDTEVKMIEKPEEKLIQNSNSKTILIDK